MGYYPLRIEQCRLRCNRNFMKRKIAFDYYLSPIDKEKREIQGAAAAVHTVASGSVETVLQARQHMIQVAQAERRAGYIAAL